MIEQAFPQLRNDPLRAFDTSRITEFFSDHVARVDPEGPDKHGLVASLAPLRDRNDEGTKDLVDPSLEAEDAHFESTNPVVDVSLPSQATKPILFQGTGFGIELLAPAAASSEGIRVADDKLFYYEVAKDTDLTVAPITGGVELLAHIRSAGAPDRLRFKAILPEAAHLREIPGEAGIGVIRNGERLATIGGPAAVDARGYAVDTNLRKVGSNLIELVTEHKNHPYPVAVDPPVVTEDWKTSGFFSQNVYSPGGGWYPNQYWYGDYSAPQPTPTYNTIYNGGVPYDPTKVCNYWAYGGHYDWTGPFCWGSGLYVSAGTGWQMKQQAGGEWQYNPSGNSSYIQKANLSPIYFYRNGGETSYPTPHAYYGVFSRSQNDWVRPKPIGVNTNGGELGPSTSFYYDRAVHGGYLGDEVAFGMAVADGVSRVPPAGPKLVNYRITYLGGALIEVSDQEAATITNVDHSSPRPTNWTNQAYNGASTVTAWDGNQNFYGLGVKWIGQRINNGAWQNRYGPPASGFKNSCSGTRANPCPATLTTNSPVGGPTPPLTYSIPTSQQGTNTIEVQAQDAPGWPAASTSWKIRMDSTPPTLGPAGITGGLRNGTGLNLSVPAIDGDDAQDSTQRSGVKSIELKIDGETAFVTAASPDKTGDTALKTQGCALPQTSCPMTASFFVDRTQYDLGNHDFEVWATDQLNQTVRLDQWTGKLVEAPGGVVRLEHHALHEKTGQPIDRDHSLEPERRWLGNTSIETLVSARDEDDGISSMALNRQGSSPLTKSFSCVVPNCEPERGHFFKYSTDQLPQGYSTASVEVRNGKNELLPARNPLSSLSWRFQIDREQPTIEAAAFMPVANRVAAPPGIPIIDGGAAALTDTNVAAWCLVVRTRDGRPGPQYAPAETDLGSCKEPTAPPPDQCSPPTVTDACALADGDRRAGVVNIKLKVAGREIAGFSRACPDSNCDLDHNFLLQPDEEIVGVHPAELIVTDGAGNKRVHDFTLTIVPQPELLEPGQRRLGMEQYFQYDSSETGGQSSAHVNLDTGNLAWHKMPAVDVRQPLLQLDRPGDRSIATDQPDPARPYTVRSGPARRPRAAQPARHARACARRVQRRRPRRVNRDLRRHSPERAARRRFARTVDEPGRDSESPRNRAARRRRDAPHVHPRDRRSPRLPRATRGGSSPAPVRRRGGGLGGPFRATESNGPGPDRHSD
jgi:hypothetical protein